MSKKSRRVERGVTERMDSSGMVDDGEEVAMGIGESSKGWKNFGMVKLF